jgi:hypothetical protein
VTAIGYAQARIQARHGARADPVAWAAVHASITAGALLANARASPLETWIAGLDAGCTLDLLERLLRDRLRGRIEEVARWMPSQWRPAVLWIRELIDLPAAQRRLRARADEEGAVRVRSEWLDAWRRLWPRCGDDDREALEALVRTVESHIVQFARAPADEAANLRLALKARVETLFRRHALGPAAAFDHLMLLALEAERLRAELVSRVARRAETAP